MADLTNPPTRRPVDALVEPLLPREAAQIQALQVRQALASAEGRLTLRPPAVLQALFRSLTDGGS